MQESMVGNQRGYNQADGRAETINIQFLCNVYLLQGGEYAEIQERLRGRKAVPCPCMSFTDSASLGVLGVQPIVTSWLLMAVA